MKKVKKKVAEKATEQFKEKIKQSQEENIGHPVEQPKEEIKEVEVEQPKEEIKEEEKNLSYVTFDKMNDRQMEFYLFELSTTIYWQAILKYIYKRDGELLGILAGLDPFKEPTIMSRSQGERIGIYNLKGLVDGLIQRNKDAVKTKEEKIIEEKGVPGYKW